MDDTMADESGLPFLSNSDDVPVHSTPIKGAKVPLPSTRHVLKKMVQKTLQSQDYTASESIQSIRLSDTQAFTRESLPPRQHNGQGHFYAARGQVHSSDLRGLDYSLDGNGQGFFPESRGQGHSQEKRVQGHSQSVKGQGYLHNGKGHSNTHDLKRQGDSVARKAFSVDQDLLHERNENCGYNLRDDHRPSEGYRSRNCYKTVGYDTRDEHMSKDMYRTNDVKNISDTDNLRPRSREYISRYDDPVLSERGNALPESEKASRGSSLPQYQPVLPKPVLNRQDYDQKKEMEINGEVSLKSDKNQTLHPETLMLENKVDLKNGQQVSAETNNRNTNDTDKIKRDSYNSDTNDRKKINTDSYNRNTNNRDKISSDSYKRDTNNRDTYNRDSSNRGVIEKESCNRYIGKTDTEYTDSNNSAYSSHANKMKQFNTQGGNDNRPVDVERQSANFNTPGTPEHRFRVETVTRISGDYPDKSVNVKSIGTTVSSPRSSRQLDGFSNKSVSTLKQNASFCELENSTLQKQRQEIQLLMLELKDRDRELSDTMKAHQQQLLAWEQDRYRLTSAEKKCAQYEEEIQSKSNQLHQAIASLKTVRNRETEQRKELQTARSLIDSLQEENNKFQSQLEQERTTVQQVKEKLRSVSATVGKLEAREEELLAVIKVKERDITAATGQMRDLSDRLKQLDWRCKECQDREKEALKEKEDWKHRHEKSEAERKSLSDELAASRAEVTQLSEENRSARQQLALLQKEIGMRERCKDELIESLKIKQERTDSQLRNIRELYERQLKEMASLQQQLDTSRQMIRHQQHSMDEQQLSGSYQSRGNSGLSDISIEKSTASQRSSQSTRAKLSPVQLAKNREPEFDMQSSNHQSSGYQSQLSENQTGLIPGTQQSNLHNVTDTHSSTGNRLNSQLNKTCGQAEESAKLKLPARPETVPKNVHFSSDAADRENVKKRLEFSDLFSIENDKDLFSIENDKKAAQQQEDNEDCNPGDVLKHSSNFRLNINYRTSSTECVSESNKDRSLLSPPRHKGFVIELDHNGILKEHNDSSLSRKYSPNREQNIGTVINQREATSAETGDETLLDSSLNRQDREACDRAMAEKYVFENKLRSFLEDIEDIDDSLWEDKTNRSINILTAEGSPASKLQKLLLESRLMIENLEKSSEFPQHTPKQGATSSPFTKADTAEQKVQKDES